MPLSCSEGHAAEPLVILLVLLERPWAAGSNTGGSERQLWHSHKSCSITSTWTELYSTSGVFSMAHKLVLITFCLVRNKAEVP